MQQQAGLTSHQVLDVASLEADSQRLADLSGDLCTDWDLSAFVGAERGVGQPHPHQRACTTCQKKSHTEVSVECWLTIPVRDGDCGRRIVHSDLVVVGNDSEVESLSLLKYPVVDDGHCKTSRASWGLDDDSPVIASIVNTLCQKQKHEKDKG